MLIKYIKSVLWRVAKRLSYIQDARRLKVKPAIKPCQSGKAFPLPAHLWPRGWVDVLLYSSTTPALEEGEGSAARPSRSLPPGKTRYPLYRRLGGPQGRSGRGESLAPTGIRSPDRPARSSVATRNELPGPHLSVRHNSI